MGRTDRQMQQRCAEDNRSRSKVRGKAVDRLDFEYFRPHRLDDLPTADGSTERHRCGGSDFYPKRNFEMIQTAGRHQRERDDPHRLLRVVRAVRERLRGCRDDLHHPEAFVHGMRAFFRKNPFQDRHDDVTDHKRDQRGKQKSFDDFDESAPFDMVRAGSDKYRSGQSADQRVRGGGRNPQPPGEKVPDNRGQQRGNDHFDPVIERGRIRDASADFFRDARKHDGPDEVHDGRQDDRRTRLERPGRYRGCDGIRRIMETVNEIKRQRQEDDNA